MPSTYLHGRGVTAELIEHFGIAYCKLNMRVGERLFRTRGRVIIPIKDFEGRVVSWQGRDITGESRLKYLFPPGFKGSEYLFNASSLVPGPAADYVILCEGVFDVFGWWRAGFRNAVATFGKKISEAQVALLRRLRPGKIFVAWDSDAAWERHEFCQRYGHLFQVEIIDLGGKDADECSVVELRRAFAGAKYHAWEDKILERIGKKNA